MIQIIENKALLDRCKFSDVQLEMEDIEKLRDIGILTKSLRMCKNDDGKKSEESKYYLKLNNIESMGFFLKSSYNELLGCNKTILETNLDTQDTRNLSCCSVAEYKKRIEQIGTYLKKEYGITMNTDYMRMSKIEINRTFRINEPFPEYERVLNLIIAQLPANARFVVSTVIANKSKDKAEKNTFYASSKKSANTKQFKEMKFYNKTKDIAHKTEYKIILGENYMRIEFTLVGAKKIESELETDLLEELTDEKINEWFDKKINEWIVKPIAKWKIEQKKKVIDIMTECKKADGYKWINKCLCRILNMEIETKTGNKPILLDVEEIIPLVNELYPNGNRRKRAKKAFRNAAAEDASNLTHRDDLKLQEVLDKLTRQAPIEKGFAKVPGTEPQKRTTKRVA